MNPTPCLPCSSVPVVTNVPGSQGLQGPTGATGPSFATSTYSAYGSGTAYQLTTSTVLLALSSTAPSIILGAAGTYLLFARARFDASGVTTGSATTKINTQIQCINNSSGTVANTARNFVLYNYLSTLGYGTVAEITTPVVAYVTPNSGDNLQLFGGLSAGLSAGTISCVEADIIAVKIQ